MSLSQSPISEIVVPENGFDDETLEKIKSLA